MVAGHALLPLYPGLVPLITPTYLVTRAPKKTLNKQGLVSGCCGGSLQALGGWGLLPQTNSGLEWGWWGEAGYSAID